MSEIEGKDDAEVAVAKSPPGSRLRLAREKADLSLDNVAAELRITKRYVQALEGDDFDALPSGVFIVGYLKAYARLLAIPVEEVVDTYHEYTAQLNGDGVKVKTVKVKAIKENNSGEDDLLLLSTSSKKPLKKGWFGWLIAVVLVFAIVVMFQDDTDSRMTSEGQVNLGSVADISEQEAPPLPDSDAVSDEISADGAAVDEEQEPAPASDEAVSSQIVVVELPAKTENPPLDSIAFNFSKECWLEVIDAQGDVLNSDLYQPGESKVLQGYAPFEVLLGNVKAVSLALNEQAVDLPANLGGQKVRLRVSAAGEIIVLEEQVAH